MDVDGLPVIGPGVDFTQVRAIHQKRTLAFINHFMLNTVSFLNKFSRSCELRFERFEGKIQKLEASLSILEAKLASISGLEKITAVSFIKKEDDALKSVISQIEENVPDISENLYDKETDVIPQGNSDNATQDPQFSRFFKMIQVGVPIQAVRLKMSAEGLDSSVLDKPNEPIAANRTEVSTRTLSESESTASSFSEE